MEFFRFAVATPATYGPRLMHWFVHADHMAAPETVKSRLSYLRDTPSPKLLSGELRRADSQQEGLSMNRTAAKVAKILDMDMPQVKRWAFK